MRLPCIWLICLTLLSGGLALTQRVQAEALQCWTETALIKIKPNDAPGLSRELRFQACRGETEWGQIILCGNKPFRVRLSAQAFKDGAGAEQPWLRLSFHPAVYVHVSLPSGNHYPEPGDWPEILPEQNVFTLSPGRNQPVYVRLETPVEASPGLYGGEIIIHASLREQSKNEENNGEIHIPVRIQIWPLTIPPVPTTRASYYLWWEGLAQRFSLQNKPELRQKIFKRFFDFMLEHRLCPMLLPVDIRQAEEFMRDPRVNAVRLPYHDDNRYLRDIIAYVKARGWLQRCYFYLYDEPPRRLWPEVLRAGLQIARIEPFMPRLDTIQPEPELARAVTIWAPNIESVYLYDERIEALTQSEQEASYSIWWYTCATPKYPYPTFLLDDDAIAPRLLFWAQLRYGLNGSLYINTIHWGPKGHDPWKEAVTDPLLRANNDGLLIYTGRGRTVADAYPVTGVRLEMIRDGLEDVELGNMLRDKIARLAGDFAARQHLAALASQILPDLRHPDRQPEHLLQLRAQIVQEILTLEQNPRAVSTLLSLPRKIIPESREPVAEDKFAVALRGTPRVDGRLDDACWQAALEANAPGCRTIITRFRNLTGRIWPSQETRVVCVYDNDYYYFAFWCSEPEAEKLQPYSACQNLAQTDRVAVGIWQNGQEKWHIVTVEGLRFEGSLLHPQWANHSLWKAQTQQEADGYTAEICLPRLSGQEPVLFNLFRYAACGQETLYFTGRYSSKHNPFQFGRLELR